MSFLDTVKHVGGGFINTVDNIGDNLVDGAKTVGSKFVDSAEIAGKIAVKGGQVTTHAAVETIKFEARLTRYGLEKTLDGANAVRGAASNVFNRVTHPGNPNPPGAQGLKFSESKGASTLAYDAQKGEIYRFPDGKQWQVVDVKDDQKTGFRAIALKSTDPSDNRVIVAFAGTGDGKDWKANIGQGLGLPTKQYNQAVEFANKWKATNGNNVILTGHSLGGGLASYASIKTGLRATAINAAPLALNHIGLNPRNFNRITQYYVPGEALTVLDGANRADTRPGNHILVQGRHSILDPRSVGRNHSLDNTAPGIPKPVKVN
jgi:hypothetical protein